MYSNKEVKPVPKPNPLNLPIDPGEEDRAYRSRNDFVMSQSPKRTALKSYCRIRKPNKKQNDHFNSTFSTFSAERNKEGHYMRVTVKEDDLNFKTIPNNPLRNDKARGILVSILL